MYGRVPLTGSVGKNRLVEENSTWVYQKMAAGVAFDGLAPATAVTVSSETEPTVTAGCATFADLTHGGLFVLQGPLEILVVTNTASATLTIVDTTAATTRTAPTTTPFLVGPGEVLKAVGGTAGSSVGIMVIAELPWR